MDFRVHNLIEAADNKFLMSLMGKQNSVLGKGELYVYRKYKDPFYKNYDMCYFAHKKKEEEIT